MTGRLHAGPREAGAVTRSEPEGLGTRSTDIPGQRKRTPRLPGQAGSPSSVCPLPSAPRGWVRPPWRVRTVRTGFSALWLRVLPLIWRPRRPPDTARRDAPPAPRASLVPVKVTHEIGHHGGRSAAETPAPGTQGQDETQSPVAEARKDSERHVDGGHSSLTLRPLDSFVSSDTTAFNSGGEENP